MSDQLSSSIIMPRPYLHWLIFGGTLVTILFQLTSISLLSRVLFCRFVTPHKFQTRNMSQMMIIYMAVHIIGSLFCLPYHFYLVIYWRPATPEIQNDAPLYDPYAMYWMGIFMAVYLYTPAVPVFFLTLDRCIALKFPIHYNGKFMREKMAITALVITIIWCVALIIGLLQELPLNTTTVKYCLIVDCVTIKYNRVVGKYMKLSVVILNVLCTAYFLYALRTFKLSVGERNVFSMKNRVVIVTAVSETILNVAPTLFTTIFTSIYNDSPSDILGNYGIVMFTLDAMICSIFYVKIYMRTDPQSIIINQYLGVNIVHQHHRPSASMTNTSNMNS